MVVLAGGARMIQYYLGTPRCEDQMWRAEMQSVAKYCEGEGCDPGAGRRTFSPEIVRVDINPEHQPHHVGDALHLPFADNTFDFVVNSHLIEHLPDPRAALREWLRVVRPGGHVCCVIPNTIFTRGQNTDPTPHLWEWSPREFLEDVIGCPQEWPWWTIRDWPIDWAQATMTELMIACPQWSFAVVLEKCA